MIRSRPNGFRCSAALLVAVPTLLWGCSDRNAEAEQVTEVARDLAGAHVGEDGSYATVSASLSGLDLDSESASSAASGLLSQSLQGTGSVEAGEAIRAERALFAPLHELTRLSRRYAELRITASALAAFDPSDELARIESEAQSLAEEAQQAEADRAGLAEEIAGLHSRAEALEAESLEKRNLAAEMKLASASATAEAAARDAVIIRARSREADALDMQSSRIRGRIETLSPQLAEIDAGIAKLNEQRRLALESGENLRRIESEHAEAAVRTKAEAATLAEQIGALVEEIAGHRVETVAPAHEAALDALTRAVRSADAAARGSRASGQLAKSAALRRIGDAHTIRAQGLDRFAAALEDLADSDPALPRAQEYGRMALEQRAAAEEHRSLAIEAYEDAIASLRGTGLRGSERDQLEAAASDLEKRVAAMSGTPAPAQPPAEESADPQAGAEDDPGAAEQTPTEQSGDADTP